MINRQFKYFVYNENNQVIGEYDIDSNVITEYFYFGLRPVAVKTNGVLYAVHTDYLGTPRVITGLNGGSVVWEWKNDNPYGNNKAQGSIEFNLRFAGQYYDYESGLHYNMNRTYNPETGRYLQSDPLGLAAGLNTYNYVNKNPLDGVDPLGLVVKLMVVQDSSLGHVALNVNGQTYGLMPYQLRYILALVNYEFDGYIKKYSEKEFIDHYTNGMNLDGNGYYDEISQYEIPMNEMQEQLLLQSLEEKLNKNVHYQGIPKKYDNCASFATIMLNVYSGINFKIKYTPDGTVSYFNELAKLGVVKKLKTIYPKR